ncbi:hypothetical protein D3C75_1372750 [compost metagenome]|jgi:hypothetical protein
MGRRSRVLNRSGKAMGSFLGVGGVQAKITGSQACPEALAAGRDCRLAQHISPLCITAELIAP